MIIRQDQWVMLQTPKTKYPSILLSSMGSWYGWYDCAIRTPHTTNHLYLINNDPVDDGDWCLHRVQHEYHLVKAWSDNPMECWKIVATTDELISGYTDQTHPTQDNSKPIFIQNLSRSLVDLWVDKRGEVGYFEWKFESDEIVINTKPKNNNMKKKRKLQIAMACHKVHNVLCESHGLQVIPWEDKSPEHHTIVIDSIDRILSGEIESPEEAHDNFVAMKEADGWDYDTEYSTANKTNPRLCDWDELDDVDRMKEELFFAVASSFIKRKS